MAEYVHSTLGQVKQSTTIIKLFLPYPLISHSLKMARTRTTPRVKPAPKMIPNQITTPPSSSSAASATPVTENSSEPGSCSQFPYTTTSDNEFENENEQENSSQKSDNSVKSDVKIPAKRRLPEESDKESDNEEMSLSEEDGQIGDDKPVILEAEEETDESSDNEEEVVYLGTSKPPAISNLPEEGNLHQNVTMTYCIGNVNFGKAHGHFMMLSNGLDQHDTPRHNFRNFLMELYVRNGKYYMTRLSLFRYLTKEIFCTASLNMPQFSPILFLAGEITWFNKKGIAEENLVKCVDHNGEVLSFPSVRRDGTNYLRHVWSVVIFTPNILPPERLTTLYNDFSKAYNTGTWLNKKMPEIGSLTPSPLLPHPEGIGKWICAADLQQLLKQIYPTFAPRTGWGTQSDHQAILAGFWPKGKWTLKHGNTFGVPTNWMSREARNEYSKLNAKANKKPKK